MRAILGCIFLVGTAFAQLPEAPKDGSAHQIYHGQYNPGLLPLEFNPQFGPQFPQPQYSFDPSRGLYPSQPQVFFYGAAPGQPFLLNPGAPPGNFLYPQAPQNPEVLFRNPNQPQPPVFVAGYPKPAHVPPVEKDAEEVPTNPAKVPPFQPKKPTGTKPEKIETFNENENLEPKNNIEPKGKPGHRFFVLNGQQLFNYPNVFGASIDPYNFPPNAALANSLQDEEKQQAQPDYAPGQPLLLPYNHPENQYVPLIPQQQNYLRAAPIPGHVIQHPTGQNFQQQGQPQYYPVQQQNFLRSEVPLNQADLSDPNEVQIRFPLKHAESLPGSKLVAGGANYYLNEEAENDAVVIDAKDSEEPKNEAIVQTPKKAEQSSLSQAGPGAIALAGEGGVAAASPRGTAFVGKDGLAISSPKATAIAGPEKKNEEFGAKKDKKKVTTTEKTVRPTRERTARRLVKSRFDKDGDKKEEIN